MRSIFRQPWRPITEAGEQIKSIAQPDREQTEDCPPQLRILIREQRVEILSQPKEARCPQIEALHAKTVARLSGPRSLQATSS